MLVRSLEVTLVHDPCSDTEGAANDGSNDEGGLPGVRGAARDKAQDENGYRGNEDSVADPASADRSAGVRGYGRRTRRRRRKGTNQSIFFIFSRILPSGFFSLMQKNDDRMRGGVMI
jgi:hypothetical protein